MFHSSAFPHASWHLHNCSDSQFCPHLWKKAKVHTVGKASPQLLCSACYLPTAILHMLDAQGSVKHALKPSAALDAYLSHSPCPFVIHVPHPPAKSSPCSSDLLWTSSHLLLLQTVPGCCFKAISSSVVSHSSSGEDKQCLKPKEVENISIGMFC